MQDQPSVFVLSQADYRRIETMLASLSRALDTLFDRRLVEPRPCPDDTEDFDDVADKVHGDYLF
jgi:hypothetical protein